eukprot:1137430-Pelagomonas_calceolata.AAC.2
MAFKAMLQAELNGRHQEEYCWLNCQAHQTFILEPCDLFELAHASLVARCTFICRPKTSDFKKSSSHRQVLSKLEIAWLHVLDRPDLYASVLQLHLSLTLAESVCMYVCVREGERRVDMCTTIQVQYLLAKNKGRQKAQLLAVM